MLLWTLLAGAALAQDAAADLARAKELYENGAELYAEGLYEEAILAWKEGYSLSQLPDFLFNIAGAEERLGDWRSALDTLSRYRAFATTEERETLARRIRNLEERLAAEASRPAPAPQPAPQPAPAPTPAPAPVASGARRSLEPVVVGSLFGLAGVGVATGLVQGFGAAVAGRDAQALCVELEGSFLCPVGASGPLRQERTRALSADLAFGFGAASLLGGVVVLAVPGRHGGTASLGVSPAGAAVTFAR